MRRRTAIGLLGGAPAIGALIGGVAKARSPARGKPSVRTMLEMTFPEFEARIDRVKATGPAGVTRLRLDIARLLRGETAAMKEARLAGQFRRAAQTLQEEEDRIA